MGTRPDPAETSARRRLSVPARRLWFGFATAAAAWVALGCVDIVIAWRACTHQYDYGIPDPHPAARVALTVLACALLIVGIAAGVASYRNWQSLATAPAVLDTLAVDRREFMAVMGIIVSVTLGMGMLWLAIPPFFLDLCWRAR